MSDDDSEDFDWNDVDVVVPEQQRVAVYINPQGAIVVRGDGDWYRREDPWIVIRPENARRVAEAIMALAVELGAEPPPQRLALPAPAPADPTAAERQRRHRERKRNGETTVTVTPVTPCARNGADLFPD